MDQEPSARHQLAWWTEAVFHDWRNRPGPRYARLAAAILEAIDRKTLHEGTRVPAERTLAAAVGVSRGTVVACFDHLTAAGVLTRPQVDGTYVARPPRPCPAPSAPAATWCPPFQPPSPARIPPPSSERATPGGPGPAGCPQPGGASPRRSAARARSLTSCRPDTTQPARSCPSSA